MKKVIISVCAVVAAAAAVQAQGVARDFNYFGREYLAQQIEKKAQASKQEARQTQALDKAVRKAAEKHRHQQMLAATQAENTPVATKATPEKPAAKEAAGKQAVEKAKPAAQKAKKKTFGQKLLAAFGGRYDWETDEQYHQRLLSMGHVSNQPFK